MPTENKDTITVDVHIHGVEIDPTFSAEVERKSGEKAVQCYQCGECTAGCPAAFAMDITPNRVMRMVQLGCEKTVLSSSTIWLCAGCETCATRCPRGLSVAKVMDACRELAAEKGVKSKEPGVVTFHEEFLADVARNGRVHEVGLIALYKMKSRDLFSDVPMGIKMFFKGKLALLPTKIKGVGEVRKIFRKMAAK
jgi:heterodisulfide reductase subunit C